MRREWALVAALAMGCQSLERPSELWMMQIDSANAIPDPNTRGGNLARIAESASYVGDAVAARYTLSQLGDGPQRDELAARCATHLAVHDRETARSFVEEISDSSMRDETLAKLDETSKNESPPAKDMPVESDKSADGR